jgi:hypothetical protein
MPKAGLLTTGGSQDSRTRNGSELKTTHCEIVCLSKNHRLIHVQNNSYHINQAMGCTTYSKLEQVSKMIIYPQAAE